MKTIDRLKRRSDFLRVQREGRKWTARGLTLLAAPNGLEKSRFGLTVTTRISKSAVIRNRARRRLRAAAYDILPQVAAASIDYVIIARAETAGHPYDQLCRDLEWCLQKLGCARRVAADGA